MPAQSHPSHPNLCAVQWRARTPSQRRVVGVRNRVPTASKRPHLSGHRGGARAAEELHIRVDRSGPRLGQHDLATHHEGLNDASIYDDPDVHLGLGWKEAEDPCAPVVLLPGWIAAWSDQHLREGKGHVSPSLNDWWTT